ncbi:hypothetical protein [Amycolatopsis sp. NPDC051071]|uniref:hypothetical protein n=1 Tax=Amycolatopsis sp. NPDC051071 TaxID=3154637 RepID=UPI00343E31BA
MKTRYIAAVTAGVLLTMAGVSGTATAADWNETYLGSYDSQSDCQGTGASKGDPAGARWSGYRCEGRWERGPQDDEYKYALYVKNYQPPSEEDVSPTFGEGSGSTDPLGDAIRDAVKEGKLVVQGLDFND